LALRAVLGSHAGQAGQAARELIPLFDRLLAMEQKCAPNLVAAMSLSLALQHVGRGFSFALAQPTLDHETETALWRGLLRLEQRPSPIPNALRWEARWMRETLRQPIDRTTVEQAARGQQGRPLSWPFYDPDATLALGERLARRNIWVAEQPLGAPTWTGPTPEAAFLERLDRQPRALLWLRYNSAGAALVAMAQPDWRKYSLKWHRDRCLAAAQRARWIEELRRPGPPPPPRGGAPAPLPARGFCEDGGLPAAAAACRALTGGWFAEACQGSLASPAPICHISPHFFDPANGDTMRPQDRERIQVEVVSRVVDRYIAQARRAREGFLEELVNDTIYHERRRLEHEKGRRARAESRFYDELHHELQHASEQDLRGMLERIARHFVAEVVGNFDERVYRIATRLVPPGLWALLNAMSPSRLLSSEGMQRGLADHLQVQGEVEHVRRLLGRGTLVVVPTHFSNLDSIVIGYAVYLLGLPPLTYGAGLNLFTNPLISFFMRNLGAYKVDRKKMARVYKDVLKEYATCSLEMGYHNLFFPGGTRSRSGAVEQRLKLGLLGTAVSAFVGRLQAGMPDPGIYLVPCTINYKLVLEAETLIGDYLTETGQARYIIEDDEFSRPRRVLNFMSHILSMESKIVLHLGRPLDIFGNQVDESGQSIDARGRPIDSRRYLMKDGTPVLDEQRDAQFTRDCAEEIIKSYRYCNVVMSTNLAAYALFNLLQRQNPDLDLYRLLRTGGRVRSWTMHDVHAEVERVRQCLLGHSDGPQLDSLVRGGDVQEIVADALKHFAIYHTRPAAVRRGDRVFHEDRELLYYYRNRLRGYQLGRRLNAGAPRPAASSSSVGASPAM
jgi:glycerol-3-phosphate O-acyltransferase